MAKGPRTTFEKVAAKLGSTIITVSEDDRRLAHAKGVAKLELLNTIWNGIGDTRFRANPAASGTTRIVMTARFAAQKDHLTLLYALNGIAGDYELQFIGDGPTLPLVRETAHRLGLEHRIKFLGDCSNVEELLSRAHLFVLSTKWEGLPISILEGMRAGLPVIATDVGGVKEAVDHGVTGYLVPPGGVLNLEGRILELVKNPERRLELGQAGRERYERDFTLERMLSRTAAIYNLLLVKGKSTGTSLVLGSA